jgi:hypothetical protein
MLSKNITVKPVIKTDKHLKLTLLCYHCTQLQRAHIRTSLITGRQAHT